VREPVLDVGALRAAAFTPGGGLARLLAAMTAPACRVPAEVYNGDEDASLPVDDVGLSVLARDIRALRRRADDRHWATSQHERAALRNAERLRDHLADGTLVVDALWPGELLRREELQLRYGIGRGEAASLVLAERHGAAVVYRSTGDFACDAARREGVRFVAIREAVAA
jgi:hypothetical protein